MNLLISLRSEILKTKRTAAFYFTLAGAAVIPFMSLLGICLDGVTSSIRDDPFNAMFRSDMNILVIFPLFIILICTLIPQIEQKNNTWKQVFASPQTKANVFIAKFLNIHLLILLYMVTNHLFVFLTAIVTHFIFPDLRLLQQPLDGYRILVSAANSYIFLLAISALQFWIGLRFKNFIVPIAIGLVLWFTGTLLVMAYHSSSAKYFPYSFQVFSYYPPKGLRLQDIAWTSMGYAALFLGLGFLDFRRRRMNL